jgi:hypothetical protein
MPTAILAASTGLTQIWMRMNFMTPQPSSRRTYHICCRQRQIGGGSTWVSYNYFYPSTALLTIFQQKADATRKAHAAKTTPAPTEAPSIRKRGTKLNPPKPPAQPEQKRQEAPMEVEEERESPIIRKRGLKLNPPKPPTQPEQKGKDVPMEVDEELGVSPHAYCISCDQSLMFGKDPQRHKKPKVAKKAAAKRKRRGSSGLAENPNPKRRTRSNSRQRSDSAAEQGLGDSDTDHAVRGLGTEDFQFTVCHCPLI